MPKIKRIEETKNDIKTLEPALQLTFSQFKDSLAEISKGIQSEISSLAIKVNVIEKGEYLKRIREIEKLNNRIKSLIEGENL